MENEIKTPLFLSPWTAALVAFGVSLFLAAGKAVLWLASGSATVLASLADSLQDCLLSATNFLAIRYAMQPADDDHRFGHGKMEGIAALGQAAFIAGSCVYILLDSLRRLANGTSVDHPGLVAGFIGLAIILNALLVFYQKIVIVRSGSLAIEADRAHYIGDIGIHLGVLAAVGGDYFFGLTWLDPLIAVGIALILARLAWTIGRKAVDMLMDRELPEEERETIKTLIRKTRGVVHFHDLRTYRSGTTAMISFDIEVDPGLPFREAHAIAKRVEDRLHKVYPQSEIMIHVDPCGDIADSRHKRINRHHVR